MITSFADFLGVTSIILFVVGFLGMLMPPLRKALKKLNKKLRLRHLFISSLICFGFGLMLGWDDFMVGLNGECAVYFKAQHTDVQKLVVLR